MVMMNDMDRYHLVMDVIDRTPSLGHRAASLRQEMVDTRRRARQWTRDHGDDLPEVRDWQWVPSGESPERDNSPSVTAAATTSADF
jgi:xylulose-5-phosphate/fructose-6-phosphate phosphoketolase